MPAIYKLVWVGLLKKIVNSNGPILIFPKKVTLRLTNKLPQVTFGLMARFVVETNTSDDDFKHRIMIRRGGSVVGSVLCVREVAGSIPALAAT